MSFREMKRLSVAVSAALIVSLVGQAVMAGAAEDVTESVSEAVSEAAGMDEMPQMPEGMSEGEMPQGMDGQTPPDKPDGEMGGGPGGDMGDMSGGPGGKTGGMSEGDVAGATNAVNTDAAIVVSDGSVSCGAGTDGEAADYSSFVSEEDGTVVISGVEMTSDDYTFTGIYATNSDVQLTGSVIDLNVGTAVDGSETAGTALYADSGTVSIEDSTVTVDGAGRYTVAAVDSATLAVNDSAIIAGGDLGADGNTSAVDDPASNGALLISGDSRSNFSVGASHTFYYNSLCAAEGWAALSTDSATGSGLELVAVGTEALAQHGGYGTYADTNCRDYLYGVYFASAEIGAIISNNGSITVASADAAQEAVTQDGHAALEYQTGEAAASTGSTIVAGRNDFQLHSPDMMGEGTSDYSAQLSLTDTALITDDSINADGLEYTSAVTGETYTIQATCDYAETYGEAVGAYIDYVSGAAILAKSTSADITLSNVTVDSCSGTALLTTINSDSMSRYLKSDVGNGVNVTITDSTIDGSFVHDDYQRSLSVTAAGSTINGAVTSRDADSWNEMWADYADDENCCWVLDAATYVTDRHPTGLTLTDGSVWHVTGDSQLDYLSVDETSQVVIDENVTLTVDGTAYASGDEVTGTLGTALTGSTSEMAVEEDAAEAVTEEAGADGADAAEPAPAGEAVGEGQMPQMPEGMSEGEMPQGMHGQTPPDKPDGEMGGMNMGDGQTPPDKPDGEMGGGPGGDMGDMSGGPGGDMGSMSGDGSGSDSSAASAGVIGSWSAGGTDETSEGGNDYAYDAALYVTADGIDEEKSTTDRISTDADGSYYTESSADGITIDDPESGHNGILIVDTPYNLTHATINLLTDADGSDTCDFSGKGTAVAAFGSGAVVTIEDSTIHTSGVATMPVFADDGATVTVKSSVLTSDGGTLSQGYMNTPDQALMVAPPWILGIMGTSRCSNMMGTDTTTNVIDSETSAGAWAVLSTDAGTDMYLNVYNTSLTLNNTDESQYLLQEEGGEISETLDNPYTENYGSGYGTYAIGNAVETFAGSTLNVGTYATIFTGGSALFTALEAGETYELKNSAGETTCEYTAEEDKVTTINSDTFGFMAHQSTNSLTIEKGTVVNSGYATFLVKTGSSSEQLTATVDDSEITNGGVLIQIMDNDDATNGGMMSTTDEANTNGGSQNFNPVHYEDAGFSTDAAGADSTEQSFTFTNGVYEGQIYNASGSDGLSATTLNVTLGSGAVYNGAAAQTSAIHVTYDGSVAVKEAGGFAFDDAEEAAAFAETYQNTEFTINEYFSIGQVANLICDNGGNTVHISLSDDAVWNVTGTSRITSLTIADNARVIVPEGITLTVGSDTYTGVTLSAGDV